MHTALTTSPVYAHISTHTALTTTPVYAHLCTHTHTHSAHDNPQSCTPLLQTAMAKHPRQHQP